MLTRPMLLALSFSFLVGCIATTSSVSITSTSPNGAFVPIPMALFKPDVQGPFPAVVIMHDCSGLGPRSSGAPERWAKESDEGTSS